MSILQDFPAHHFIPATLTYSWLIERGVQVIKREIKYGVVSVLVFGKLQGYSLGYDWVLSCGGNESKDSLCVSKSQTRTCATSSRITAMGHSLDQIMLHVFSIIPLKPRIVSAMHMVCICWNLDTRWCSQAPISPVITHRWKHSSWSTVTNCVDASLYEVPHYSLLPPLTSEVMLAHKIHSQDVSLCLRCISRL